jgi:hypothetical protein
VSLGYLYVSVDDFAFGTSRHLHVPWRSALGLVEGITLFKSKYENRKSKIPAVSLVYFVVLPGGNARNTPQKTQRTRRFYYLNPLCPWCTSWFFLAAMLEIHHKKHKGYEGFITLTLCVLGVLRGSSWRQCSKYTTENTKDTKVLLPYPLCPWCTLWFSKPEALDGHRKGTDARIARIHLFLRVSGICREGVTLPRA